MLRRHHDDPLTGHFSYARTLGLVGRKYYWPGMAKYIKAYITSFTSCQGIKPGRHTPYSEL